MDKLNRDELFSIATKLSLKDLSNFSLCNKKIREIIWLTDDIWYVKIKEIENFNCVENVRKRYLLFYSVDHIKKELDINFDIYNCKEFHLSYKNICKIPKTIGSLINIEYIRGSENLLSTIPKEIYQLANLKSLHLSNNRFKYFPKEICYIPNLEYLDLNYNQIINIPLELENLIYLKRLYLSENRITKIPRELAFMENLELISLTHNPMKHIPKEFYQNPKLKIYGVKY